MASKAKDIGPFPGSVKPVRTGLYLRISKRGNEVWSWFDATARRWGMYGTNKDRAYRRRNKTSRDQSLQWIGRTQG